MAPKKVIYLFGSGATHAVINSIDPTKQLLTPDIRQKIREKESEILNKKIETEIWNELMDPTVDIEHLISVLETNYHYSSAQKIKEYYHDAIISLSKDFILNVNHIDHTPNLYTILFDLHSVSDLEEKVISVFTLNYEDLLERSLKEQLNINTNYLVGGIANRKRKKEIPIIKLHGSFNWKNTRPVSFGDTNNIDSAEALWIPPGVDKKKENYPFNILWGKAFEFLMDCDILRVIGCSLNRNDWGLIPLIYTAMRLSKKESQFDIEIIDFIDVGESVKKSYPYLNLKTILEVKEFNDYLIDYYLLKADSMIPQYVEDDLSSNASKKVNIFEWWLKAKRFELQHAGKNFKTRKQFLSNFS